MTFKHVKAVGNKYYLYEVTSIWDPEKKSPRQKRKYLGCCDAEGNLIPSSRSLHAPNVSKTIGTIWLINEVASNLHIRDKVRKIAGDEIADVVMAYAYQNSVRPVTFDRFSAVAEESVISDLFGPDFKMPDRSPDDIRNIRSSFTYAMCGESTGIVAYVSDGCWSMYSSDGALLGCGSIRFDFGVYDIMDLATRNVPFASGCTFVLDESVYSKKFVTALYQNGIEFIMSVPPTRKSFKAIVNECAGSMHDVNRLLSIGETRREVGSADVRAIAVSDELRSRKEFADFEDTLESIQIAIEGMSWSKGLRGVLRDCYGDIIDCLEIKKGPNGTVETDIDGRVLLDMTFHLGRSVLVTNSNRSAEDIYEIHKNSYKLPTDQDCVESDLNSLSRMIASILRNDIIKRMDSSESFKDMDYDDVINELSKLKVSRFGNEWVLNDVSEKQKEILNALSIPVPTNESVRAMMNAYQ